MNSEILEYIKDRYTEEVARFSHVEAKSGQLLNLLSVLIAAFGAMVGFRNETLFEICTMFDGVILAALLATILCLATAWSFSLAALKLGKCPIPNRSRDNSEHLLSVPSEDALAHIMECYVNTTELLSPLIEKKARTLDLSYLCLVLSALLAGIFSILLIAKEFIQ